MAREPMTMYSQRVPDALKQACLKKADQRDEVLSEEVRAFLEAYAQAPRGKRQRLVVTWEEPSRTSRTAAAG